MCGVNFVVRRTWNTTSSAHLAHLSRQNPSHLPQRLVRIGKHEIFTEENDSEQSFCLLFPQRRRRLKRVLVHRKQEKHRVSHAPKVRSPIRRLIVLDRHINH